MRLFAQRIDVIGSENAFKIGPYIKEVEETGMRVIRCNLGEPDFPTPKHITDEIKRQVDNDRTHYCDPQGVMPLREAVARNMGKRRGLEITPERVVVFAGAKPPIGFCQQVYCDPGDEVIYPSPAYPIFESFIPFVGAKPVPLHLDEKAGFSFQGSDLEPLITTRTKMIFLNFPSNPTGGVATREQLEEIAEVIQRKAPAECRVYSDEIYENILFDGHEHHSIASCPGMAKRTILISGVSKSYSWTGARIGWAVFPTFEEADVFRNMNINYYSCLSEYNQLGAKVALESPESEPSIRRMVNSFRERRDVAVERLNTIPGISCRAPKGTFYLFPNISGVCESIGAIRAFESLPEPVKKKSSPSTLVQMFLLFRHGMATMDRRSFGQIGHEGRHYLRLSVATAMDDLKEGLRRMAEAVKDREGFAAFVKEGNRLY